MVENEFWNCFSLREAFLSQRDFIFEFSLKSHSHHHFRLFGIQQCNKSKSLDIVLLFLFADLFYRHNIHTIVFESASPYRNETQCKKCRREKTAKRRTKSVRVKKWKRWQELFSLFSFSFLIMPSSRG